MEEDSTKDSVLEMSFFFTFSVVDPSSRPTRTVRSTSSAILGSVTFSESCTRSVTSTCQSGPSIVMTWSVPSEEVVWNWVKTLTRALWYCSVHPRLTRRSSSSSSPSLSLVLLRGRHHHLIRQCKKFINHSLPVQ